MARRADLTPGTRIQARHFTRLVYGTVLYLERDYDGRSWRWSVMYETDEGKLSGAWLPDVKVVK